MLRERQTPAQQVSLNFHCYKTKHCLQYWAQSGLADFDSTHFVPASGTPVHS